MLTTADMGIGSAAPTVAMRTRHVRIERAFIWQGQPTKVGDVLELPAPFASEMVSYNKATFVKPPAPAPAPEPAPAEPEPEAVAKTPARRGRAKE